MSRVDSATRRAARQARRRHSPLSDIPWTRIENTLPTLTMLGPEQVEQLHDASMRIVEEIGIAFMDGEALDLWAAAGADVDRHTQMVRMDRAMLLELVGHAPSSFTWRARNPARTVEVGGDCLLFAPNGGTIFTHDNDLGRRPGVMEDYDNFLRLVQMSNVLHVTGDQLVVPHDVPVSFRHLRRSFSALTLTDRAYMEAPHDRIISADAVRMAQLVFGDDVIESDEPVLGGIINASSPLRYDDRMIGGMLTYARAGQVLIITPFILAGAMSPITMAAAVAQQNAEALAGIALVQLVRKGAPVVYGGFATNVDMKSGSPAFGTPEGAWAMAVGAQMARRYNLPFRGSGTLNTAKLPDAQAAYETMWSIWPAVMAHTNFVMHAVGWLDAGLVASFEKFIIDVENLAMFQRFLQGIEISEETLALEMMALVGPGGHHFGTPHTQARFESEFYPSFLADRQNYENWQLSGAEDTAMRANRIYKQVLADYQPPPIDPALYDALADFVARRQRELVGVELYS